jgi:peptidoglycan/LPS O-acetylase OafA/YrhL
MPGDGRTTRGSTPTRRPDIDGLRALAILLVVAYHAHVPGLSAGFIGVDIFFVVSGFLITGLIVDEIMRTGDLDLPRFWIRRARRLLPAATVLIAAVLVANPLVGSPLAWRSTIADGVAALTYRSNLAFAAQATDYFGPDVAASPFLHTWSLAVEEQFYLVWPLLFFLLARLAPAGRGRSVDPEGQRPQGRLLAGAVAAVTLGSFALSVHLTGNGSPDAFFSALSRAWEFGAGALLALALLHRGPLPVTLRRGLSLGGLALLAGGLLTIGEATPFPGWAALLPVAATIALIAAEPTSGRLGALLAARPLQAVGRLSYSWYLWHWPVVVLGIDWLQRDTVAVRVALSLAALVPAELTRRLVENPIRFSPVLARSSVASVGVVTLITFGGIGIAEAEERHTDRTLSDPLLAMLHRTRADHVSVQGNCASTDPRVITTACRAGDTAGSGVILVLGDSHAAHWIPAVDGAGQALGLQVTASVLGNCPSLQVRWNRQVPRCTRRQADLAALLDAIRPDLVVVSHSIGYLGGLMASGRGSIPADQVGAWRDAVAALADDLRARGAGLLVILDTPRFDEDPIDCMARTRSPADCAAPGPAMRSRMAPAHDAEQAGLASANYGIAWDPLPRLCAEQCPVMVDGAPVYADSHHLTASFSRSFAADLEAPLRAALAGHSAAQAG